MTSKATNAIFNAAFNKECKGKANSCDCVWCCSEPVLFDPESFNDLEYQTYFSEERRKSNLFADQACALAISLMLFALQCAILYITIIQDIPLLSALVMIGLLSLIQYHEIKNAFVNR